MQSELSRPIVGIENRTAQEVFDIMCDRFRTEFGDEEAPRYTTRRLHEEIRKAEERGRQHEREAALSAAEPVKPYGYVYESTVRYFDGRGPQRKVDFSYTKKNISDDDIEEFEISETAVYSALSAQVQDVAETEADIVERMVKSVRDPFPTVNLSISRGIDGWRELMRDALRAAAPAKQEG